MREWKPLGEALEEILKQIKPGSEKPKFSLANFG
jgi:hypothetical protein